MDPKICDQIINSMLVLAIRPIKGKKYDLNNSENINWERNDLSMPEVLNRLEDQYRKKDIFDAVKQKLLLIGDLYSKTHGAIISDILESTKTLLCLHLLIKSDQNILTENEFFDLLSMYPTEDYKGNFISIAHRYHITISQMLKHVIIEIDSEEIGTIVSGLKVFTGYKYSFVVPDNLQEVMDLIGRIEKRINILQAYSDERIRRCVANSRITIDLFRDEYLDPIDPGMPFT